MHAPPFLRELVVIFGIAIVVVLVLSRFRLPTIAGFIVAGALLGPAGLGLVDDPQRIAGLAEAGVVLLLFTIGLELSPSRLRRLWRVLAIGGGLQVGLTIGGVVALALAFGESAERGVFFGFLVALSSTAIVLRALDERQETDAPHGRLIVGALVFQDLCVVPMMLAVPMMGGAQEASVEAIARAVGGALGLIFGTILFGRLVLPRLLGLVARSGSRELFLLAVLLVVAGVAWASSLAGLSLALGAFLAGIVLADGEYGHQAMSDVLPFREALTSLFFVSVGMLFDYRVLLEQPVLVVALVSSVLVGKTLVAGFAAMFMRFPAQVAILSGVGLAQIGEFSFVLAQVGSVSGLLTAEENRQFVAMSVITMAITPVLFRLGPRLAAGVVGMRRLEKLLGATGVDELEPAKAGLTNHIVIAGYGVAGRLLGESLTATKHPWVAVELNIDTVQAARERGEPVYYGDVTSRENLLHLDVPHAREVVILINNPAAAKRAAVAVVALAPTVPVLVRARYLQDMDELHHLGATDVVAEDFETAVEVLVRVLRAAGVPSNVIHERIVHARHRGAGLERPVTVPRRMLGEIAALAELKVESFQVRADHWICGSTLAEFHLIIAGAATVLGMSREGMTQFHPRAFETMKEGDILYLAGDNLALAVALLEKGPEALPD
jgi:CPA2 family monovalent cation:H+ antiporter-2